MFRTRKQHDDAADDKLSRAPFHWLVGPGREGCEAIREKKMLEKPGAELGTRLYAGKKRMFKGHKWERVKAHRERRQNILMRDMAKRVYNYKNVRFFSFCFFRCMFSLTVCLVL